MAGSIAFIDGRAVPCHMTPQQISVLFPCGLIGLREDLPHAIQAPSNKNNTNNNKSSSNNNSHHRHQQQPGTTQGPNDAANSSWIEPTRFFDQTSADLSQFLVFPGADGVVHLSPGKHYTLRPLDLANASMQDNSVSCEAASMVLYAVTDEEPQQQQQQHSLATMCDPASSFSTCQQPCVGQCHYSRATCRHNNHSSNPRMCFTSPSMHAHKLSGKAPTRMRRCPIHHDPYPPAPSMLEPPLPTSSTAMAVGIQDRSLRVGVVYDVGNSTDEAPSMCAHAEYDTSVTLMEENTLYAAHGDDSDDARGRHREADDVEDDYGEGGGATTVEYRTAAAAEDATHNETATGHASPSDHTQITPSARHNATSSHVDQYNHCADSAGKSMAHDRCCCACHDADRTTHHGSEHGGSANDSAALTQSGQRDGARAVQPCSSFTKAVIAAAAVRAEDPPSPRATPFPQPSYGQPPILPQQPQQPQQAMHDHYAHGSEVCNSSGKYSSAHPVERVSGGSDTTHTQGYPVEVCYPAARDSGHYHANVLTSLDDDRMPSAVRPHSETSSCTPLVEEKKRRMNIDRQAPTLPYDGMSQGANCHVYRASSSSYPTKTNAESCNEAYAQSCTPSSPRKHLPHVNKEVAHCDACSKSDDKHAHARCRCNYSHEEHNNNGNSIVNNYEISRTNTPDTAARHSGDDNRCIQHCNGTDKTENHSNDGNSNHHGRHAEGSSSHPACHRAPGKAAQEIVRKQSNQSHTERTTELGPHSRMNSNNGNDAPDPTPVFPNGENSVGVLMTDMRVSYSPEAQRMREQTADMRCEPPHIPLHQPREFKLIKDCIYEHVQLPMLAIRIIDTPEFQRLRTLKQLGTTWLLYPGATHTRFEHSIGVAHLASQMVRHIAQRQPELRITAADVLCVAIAGLCHDLGHGPFSHLFEHTVHHMETVKQEAMEAHSREGVVSDKMRRLCHVHEAEYMNSTLRYPALSMHDQTIAINSNVHSSKCDSRSCNARNSYNNNNNVHNSKSSTMCKNVSAQSSSSASSVTWRHESMSIRLLRRILSRIHLDEYGLNDADARFMELCIAGLHPRERWPTQCGRPAHKRFLVDIVANKRHGIDVDKLDYFLRDSHSVFGRAAVDVNFHRLVSACRVLPCDGELQICFEEKMALSLGDIFALRAKLHKYVYQHRLVKITDSMVQDILTAADPYFRVRGKDNLPRRISDCVGDEEAFCRLGDWILDAIAAAEEPALRPAQALIERLYRRQLYTIASSAMFSHIKPGYSEGKMKDELMDIMRCHAAESATMCAEDDDDLHYATSSVTNVSALDSAAVSSSVSFAVLEQILIVCFLTITYGSSDDTGRSNDPINEVTFFNPKKMSLGAFKLPRNRVSPLFCPSEYSEQSVLVMVRDDAYADAASRAMDVWKSRHAAYLMIGVPSSNAGLASYTRNKSSSVSAHTHCLTPDHHHHHRPDKMYNNSSSSNNNNDNIKSATNCSSSTRTNTTMTNTPTNRSARTATMTRSAKVNQNESEGCVSYASQAATRTAGPTPAWVVSTRECGTAMRAKRAREEGLHGNKYGVTDEEEVGGGTSPVKESLRAPAPHDDRRARYRSFTAEMFADRTVNMDTSKI